MKIFETNNFVRNRFNIFYKEFNNLTMEKVLPIIKLNLKNGKSFLEACSNIRILDFFKEIPQTEIFPCLLKNKNFAWISTYKGKERYFTKFYNSYNYCFDAIDLISIYYNKNFIELIDLFKLEFNLNIDSKDDDFQIKEKRKYLLLQNKLLLINKKDYPNLYKLIYKKINILYKLIEVGEKNIINENFSIDGNSLFFISLKYLKENYLKAEAISTISNVINIFYVLGFINKYSIESLPNSCKKACFNNIKSNKQHINYYSIKDIRSKELNIAEYKAYKLLQNNIRVSNFKKEKIIGLFKENFYIQSNRNKTKEQFENESLFNYKFNYNYDVIGFVNRAELKKEFNFLSNRSFHDLWSFNINSKNLKLNLVRNNKKEIIVVNKNKKEVMNICEIFSNG